MTDEWLDLLKKHTGLYDGFEFSKENELVAIEAQKCLCNIVFNSLHTANKCCKNGILDNIVKRISTYRWIEINILKYTHNNDFNIHFVGIHIFPMKLHFSI